MTTPDTITILRMLRDFAKQRPGLDPRNYISHWSDAAGRAAYRAEARRITRQLGDARELIGLASLTPDAIGPHLRAELQRGRLTLAPDGDGWRLDYTTGQYWPVEYRAAVCRVLAGALWAMLRHRHPDRHPRDSARQLVTRGVFKRWFR